MGFDLGGLASGFGGQFQVKVESTALPDFTIRPGGDGSGEAPPGPSPLALFRPKLTLLDGGGNVLTTLAPYGDPNDAPYLFPLVVGGVLALMFLPLGLYLLAKR